MISMVKKERAHTRWGWIMVWNRQLCHWQEWRPVILRVIAEILDRWFYNSIHAFCLIISLWVMGCWEVLIDSQKLAELLSHLIHKLCPSVWSYSTGDPMISNDMCEEFANNSFSGDVGARNKNHTFGEAVNYYHHVHAFFWDWQFFNEINWDLLPFTLRDWQWAKKSLAVISPYDICITLVTVLDESLDICTHIWPKQSACQYSIQCVVAWVASKCCVMCFLHKPSL